MHIIATSTCNLLLTCMFEFNCQQLWILYMELPWICRHSYTCPVISQQLCNNNAPINGIPHSPTSGLDGEIVGIWQSTMSRTPPLGHYQMSIHLSIILPWIDRGLIGDLTYLDYTMLIAHVNFTCPRGGELLSITGQFSCMARGWGSGGCKRLKVEGQSGIDLGIKFGCNFGCKLNINRIIIDNNNNNYICCMQINVIIRLSYKFCPNSACLNTVLACPRSGLQSMSRGLASMLPECL